jgi:hypothetical protein
MKKAKIFLTALTVLTVVGGALAFKVKQPHVFYTCNIPQKLCNITFTTVFETVDPLGAHRDYDVLNAFCDENNPCQTSVKSDN